MAHTVWLVGWLVGSCCATAAYALSMLLLYMPYLCYCCYCICPIYATIATAAYALSMLLLLLLQIPNICLHESGFRQGRTLWGLGVRGTMIIYNSHGELQECVHESGFRMQGADAVTMYDSHGGWQDQVRGMLHAYMKNTNSKRLLTLCSMHALPHSMQHACPPSLYAACMPSLTLCSMHALPHSMQHACPPSLYAAYMPSLILCSMHARMLHTYTICPCPPHCIPSLTEAGPEARSPG